MRPSHLVPVLLLPALAALAGCRITHDNAHGDNNVRVATPFGNMQVKTDAAATQTSTGLPPYPGAEVVQKNKSDGDHDSGAADVNMSFGSFQLRVKAVSFRTPDSPDKVKSFYLTGLRRFGDVITCQHDHAVGQPTHTAEGLTCSDKGDSSRFSVQDTRNAEFELKAGSQLHQHLVSIQSEGSGTTFALIALDLPGHLSLSTTAPESEQ